VVFASCSTQPYTSGTEASLSHPENNEVPPQTAATPVQKSVDLPSLARLYAGRFDLGVCISPDQIKGPEADLIIRHFSSITAENAMKPLYLAPYEGVYNFKYADEIVEFAEVHNMHIRGHTLVWHEQNAAWMFKDKAGAPASKDMLLKRMRDYIKTVVGRYKGRVYAWDVVNEVVNAFGFRRSDWFDIAGEDFIAEAFRTAHEADPGALLFINEFDTTERLKQNMLYKLIQRLLEAKVPVHGIGLQYHISLDYPSLQDMKKELDVFSSLGLLIHITELDMSLNSDQNLKDVTAPENLLIRQAHRYKEIFDLSSVQNNHMSSNCPKASIYSTRW